MRITPASVTSLYNVLFLISDTTDLSEKTEEMEATDEAESPRRCRGFAEWAEWDRSLGRLLKAGNWLRPLTEGEKGGSPS
jgi:hypothetical protein